VIPPRLQQRINILPPDYPLKRTSLPIHLEGDGMNLIIPIFFIAMMISPFKSKHQTTDYDFDDF
jgi:hypothetical protein